MTLARWAALITLGVIGLARPAFGDGEPRGAHGQDPGHGLVRFQSFGTAEGLHNLVILSISQDARGFLWVGSDDGIYRFDGQRFTHFGAAEGVAASAIPTLRPGPDGNMCAGSIAGLACWDGTQFSQAEAEGLPPGTVFVLASAAGKLWAGTEVGLYVRDGHAFTRAPGWTDNHPVRALYADERGVLVSDGRMVLAGDGAGAWTTIDTISNDRVTDLLRDTSGAVWIRGDQHIWRIAVGSQRSEDLSPGFSTSYSAGPTSTMVNGPHGEVWFASDSGILYRTNNEWHRVGRGEGLPFLGTRTLFVDREGSTWAGSVGLFLWRGRGLIERYEPDNGFPGDTAWRFERDPSGGLWAGTNRCLAHVTDGKWECAPGTEHREVRTMAFPPQGGVFFGGFPSELGYLDPAGKVTMIGHDGDTSDRGILSLVIGVEGDLWIATRSGLFRLPGATLPGKLERVVIPGVPSDAWYASLLISDGRLWAASNHGLVVRDPDQWRVYGSADGFRSSSVRYLVRTESRGYCVSYTSAIGLSCFTRPADKILGVTHIGLEEGLGTGAVYFMGEDRKHHLWVGTGDGVDVFTPTGVEHFGQRDGLAGDDAAANAFFEDAGGMLWLGATGGASHVHAERYDGPPPSPRAIVLAAELGGHAIAIGDDVIETPHDLNALKVELGSDRLSNAERIEYQVRLVPLEPQWSATMARQARYPALLPGTYHLEARARSGTGPWGPAASLSFVVRPAWWQTRWFLALAGLAILVAVGVGFTSRQRAALLRRTQQLNAESAANLRALLELVPDLISVHKAGVVIYGNLAARRMFGFHDGDATELGNRIHPADRERVADALRPPAGAGPHWMSPVIELRVGDDDGGWRTCEVSGVQTELEGATVVVVSGRDVTERHRLRAQLVMSDRMASLGTLAAGIAHEINNPLSYVLGNLQLMREALVVPGPGDRPRDRTEELSVAITDATDGAQRVRKIVQGLRSFSRADDERRVSLDIADVLHAAIRLTANEVRHRAQLVCELGTTPRIVADDGRLTQVFINLIVNAAHAIPEGAWHHHRITVRTRTDEHGYAAIEIEDTGQGMSPEVLARAFDPFFTTKDVGSGTGLGLSICHGIVGGLGGQIAIDSTVGRGTKILIVLPPAAGAETPAPRSNTAPMPVAAARLRVLVVDDEPLVSDMLARVLRKDHEVVSVSNGRDALDQITGGERFDAIVSDVMMPNMTGIELLDALVQIDEEQARRLIFLSGGVFTPQARAQLDALGTLQLEKPISPKELRRAVMSVARGEARACDSTMA